MRNLAIALVLLPVFGGCLLVSPPEGNDTDGIDDIDDPEPLDLQEQILSFEAQKESQAILLCDCFETLNFSSRLECEDIAFVPLSPEERACWVSAFSRNPAESAEYLACIVQAQEAHTSCLNATLLCADLDTLDECNSVLEHNVAACDSPPADVAPALEAC